MDSDDGPPAVRDAVRLLARRPLTVRELRERLAARGHDAAAVDDACRRASEAGYLDDARLALEFVTVRAERLGHGPSRLVEALVRRGVAPDVAERALRVAVEQGDLRPRELLRRRIERQLRGAARIRTRRDYARVYNALLRAGFDEEAIRRELASYRAPDSPDAPTDEATHDFP